MARILGIDPGSLLTGWAVIDADGPRVVRVASGVIRTGGVVFIDRLRIITEGIAAVVSEHQPGEVAVESAFVQKNADSAMKLGHARAAAICGTFERKLPLAEYAPREVKQAVVGKGAADKAQVLHMVCVLLNIREPLQADEADALGVALCHAFRRGLSQQLGAGAVTGSARRRSPRRRR